MQHSVRLTTAVAVVFAVALAGVMSGRARAHGRQTGPTVAQYVFPSAGIISGEEVNVSVINPNAVPPDPCRVQLLDDAGRVVAGSGDILIPAQGMITFSVPYGKLAIPAALSTGRKQFRVVVTFSNPNGLPPDPCRPGVELIKTLTGHTFGLIPPPNPDFSAPLTG